MSGRTTELISAKELIQKTQLTQRQIRFVVLYYFECYYQREIAKMEGCSRPLVSIELTEAVKKIQQAGFPPPRRLPRPELFYFANDKLNTLQKRAGDFYQWVEHDRH